MMAFLNNLCLSMIWIPYWPFKLASTVFWFINVASGAVWDVSDYIVLLIFVLWLYYYKLTCLWIKVFPLLATNNDPQKMLEFLHTDVIKRVFFCQQRRPPQVLLDFRPWASAMRSGKQITRWPSSQLHIRYQPLGREALDSGPVLPARCRAADDKVRLHNDVTYL